MNTWFDKAITWLISQLIQIQQRNLAFKTRDRVKDIFRPELGIGRVVMVNAGNPVYPLKVQYGPLTFVSYTAKGQYWVNDDFPSLKKI